jgi:hypothetical protein
MARFFYALLVRSAGAFARMKIGGNDDRQFSEKILASHLVPLKLEEVERA